MKSLHPIIIKNIKQINTIRKASSIVAQTHKVLLENIKVGVATRKLNTIAASFISSQMATSAFLGYKDYPYSICTSINDELIHGFPSTRELNDGDLLSVDVGVNYEGFCGDAAFSIQVGKKTPRVQNLINTVRDSLSMGILSARVGRGIGDISYAVQQEIEGAGYCVVKDYGGHGIGRELHEEPFIPNYGCMARGYKLKAGMTICIEPMVLEGKKEVKVGSNGWTVSTCDGKLAAHYEHTVLVTDSLPLVLSI